MFERSLGTLPSVTKRYLLNYAKAGEVGGGGMHWSNNDKTMLCMYIKDRPALDTSELSSSTSSNGFQVVHRPRCSLRLLRSSKSVDVAICNVINDFCFYFVLFIKETVSFNEYFDMNNILGLYNS